MEKILYYSTNHNTKSVTFKEALLKGLAPDGGLFMPTFIPQIDKNELEYLSDLQYFEIAHQVGMKFLKDEIRSNDLLDITKDAYNYNIPLENVYERKYVMRLDQGPTASFKDFAARMMGRLMQYYLQQENREMLILTATSGDTGSAIANAFYGLKNIKVVILFPKKEVTDRQRKQMTTLEKNIQIISLDGKFDDCQALVKQAFNDPELNNLKLSSANSINIGRLLPQSMYYIYAYVKLKTKGINEKIIFSVPSGNFGDLMGGLIANKMGLPVEKFIVSTNENNEVPVYFQTNKYKTIIPSINCISSAMNVGHPSNMARIIELYGGVMNEKGEILKSPDTELLKKNIWATSITDEKTKENIIEAWKKYKLLLEPHGSVAWTGLSEFLKNYKKFDNSQQLCVSLETAHPAKFPGEIVELLGFDPELPDSMKGLDDKPEYLKKLPNNYQIFKDFLVNNYS
ncbi:MAG: threonine synthase [Bacteroidales bacterium]|nr:threonine synthase [Bacteroidales bacterium]